MVSSNRGIRTIRWASAAVLTVSVAGAVTGCNGNSGSGADKTPSADASATVQPSADASATVQPSTHAPAAAQPSGSRPASAQEAITKFLKAVIKGQPKKACLVMAQPAQGSTPAQVGSPKRCNGNDATAQETLKNLTSMGKAFRPKSLTGDPQVHVAAIPPKGGTVVVPASDITINGQHLDDVILSHSTGVSKGQLDVKVESSRIQGSWWVTNLDFNIG